MGLESLLPDGVFTTKLKSIISWGRKNSLWPYMFGTACCSIEFMSVASLKYDISRFGAEVLRFSPRQSDLLIVGGRVSLKMMPVLLNIWDQMSEPKWAISMGACASTGGMFNTYPQIQGVDQFIPIDAYVPGCPPYPEKFLQVLMALQDKVGKQDAGKLHSRRAYGPIRRWTPLTQAEAHEQLRKHRPGDYEDGGDFADTMERSQADAQT
jgi:NADH-quinone oxidoreductase subunit B